MKEVKRQNPDIDELLFWITYSTKIQDVSLFSIEKSSSSYLSSDLLINTMSVSFILLTTSMNSCWRELLLKLSLFFAFVLNHLMNFSFKWLKVSTTRRVQLNTYSSETSQKIVDTRNSLSLSLWSSLNKAYISCFSTKVCEKFD